MRQFINFILLFLPLGGFALPSDNQQPATISSDNAVINRNQGMATFTGNVVVIQGSTKLYADKLITYNKQNKIEKAYAFGTPARYQTIPKPNEKIFYASANEIQYFANGDVILIGKGQMSQGTSNFSADYFTYNQKSGVLVSKPMKNQRTVITFIPQNLNQTQPTAGGHTQ